MDAARVIAFLTFLLFHGFIVETDGKLISNYQGEFVGFEFLQNVNLFENELNSRLLKQKENKQEISEKCSEHYSQLQVDKQNWIINPYALSFVDSEGRPSSGVLQGNIHWWGSYDQCVEAAKTNILTKEVIFKGKYCRAIVSLQTNITGFLTLLVGKCFPNSCSNEDVSQIVKSDNTSNIVGISCPQHPDYSAGDIAAIVLCSILAALMIAGTAIDLMSNKDKDQGLLPSAMISFSLVSNLPKLLSTETRSGNVTCLNGIRVLSLLWIILAHDVSFMSWITKNTQTALAYTKKFDFQAILNASIGVDTFFFLSGFLVCYLTLKQLDKTKGRLNWFLYYFHRFWRLTPVYMFTVMMVSTLVPHMVSTGPMMDIIAQFKRTCPSKWWANLLYIQNFYPGNMQNLCTGWTWYLAIDMQFYCISPFFVIALYKRPKIGYALLFLLLAMCIIVRGVVAYEYNISPLYFAPVTHLTESDHFYIRPYYRIAPYVTGLALGHWLWYKKLRISIPWPAAILGWLIAAAINISTLYGLWGYYKDGNNEMDAALVVYQAFNRWAWSLGVAWVVLACVVNKAGWIDVFLSWSGWLPLVRLSYTAYLIHVPIVTLEIFSRHEPLYFDIYTLIYKFLADVMMTFIASLVVVLAIESPLLGIEKVLLKILTRPDKRKNNLDKEKIPQDKNVQGQINGIEGNAHVMESGKNVDNDTEITKNNAFPNDFTFQNGGYAPNFEHDDTRM